MTDPAAGAPLKLLDAALDKLGHPAVAAVAWITLGVAVLVTRMTDTAQAASFVRFAAVLSAGLTAGFALTLVRAAGRGPQAGWDAVVQVVPLPFFDEELEGGAGALAGMRSSRPFVLAALAICAAVAPLSVYAFVEALPPTVSGVVTIPELGEAEMARSLDHRVSIDHDLGYAIKLDSIAPGPEPAGWTAALTIQRADGRSVLAELQSGRRLRLGGSMLALSEVRSLPEVGRVELVVTPRQEGAEPEEVTLAVGGSVGLADGTTTLEATEGAMNRLGQLGPAVRIVERQAGEVVRDEWVHASTSGVDAAHGSGNHAIRLVEAVPRFEAGFRIADSLPQHLWNPVVASVWMLALIVLVVLGARSPVAIIGRSGDYMIVALRPLAAGADTAERAARRLLSEEQLEDWRRVRAALAAEEG